MGNIVVEKVWLTDTAVWIRTADGKEACEKFAEFPRLRFATPKQRAGFTLSNDGIHWKEIDEDLSFEGFNPIYLNSIGRDGFSRNLLNGFYFGATTTMLAVQLAYWIGLREVFILGLDLDYLSSSYSRFYHEENTQVTDLLVSVQIRNLSLASRVFTEENRSIYLTNMKSWASSYMRCKDLE